MWEREKNYVFLAFVFFAGAFFAFFSGDELLVFGFGSLAGFLGLATAFFGFRPAFFGDPSDFFPMLEVLGFFAAAFFGPGFLGTDAFAGLAAFFTFGGAIFFGLFSTFAILMRPFIPIPETVISVPSSSDFFSARRR